MYIIINRFTMRTEGQRKSIIELEGMTKKARLQFWDERSFLVKQDSKKNLYY